MYVKTMKRDLHLKSIFLCLENVLCLLRSKFPLLFRFSIAIQMWLMMNVRNNSLAEKVLKAPHRLLNPQPYHNTES